jgi:diguanylate cyclase (GGDEF)-like protein
MALQASDASNIEAFLFEGQLMHMANDTKMHSISKIRVYFDKERGGDELTVKREWVFNQENHQLENVSTRLVNPGLSLKNSIVSFEADDNLILRNENGNKEQIWEVQGKNEKTKAILINGSIARVAREGNEDVATQSQYTTKAVVFQDGKNVTVTLPTEHRYVFSAENKTWQDREVIVATSAFAAMNKGDYIKDGAIYSPAGTMKAVKFLDQILRIDNSGNVTVPTDSIWKENLKALRYDAAAINADKPMSMPASEIMGRIKQYNDDLLYINQRRALLSGKEKADFDAFAEIIFKVKDTTERFGIASNITTGDGEKIKGINNVESLKTYLKDPKNADKKLPILTFIRPADQTNNHLVEMMHTLAGQNIVENGFEEQAKQQLYFEHNANEEQKAKTMADAHDKIKKFLQEKSLRVSFDPSMEMKNSAGLADNTSLALGTNAMLYLMGMGWKLPEAGVPEHERAHIFDRVARMAGVATIAGASRVEIVRDVMPGLNRGIYNTQGYALGEIYTHIIEGWGKLNNAYRALELGDEEGYVSFVGEAKKVLERSRNIANASYQTSQGALQVVNQALKTPANDTLITFNVDSEISQSGLVDNAQDLLDVEIPVLDQQGQQLAQFTLKLPAMHNGQKVSAMDRESQLKLTRDMLVKTTVMMQEKSALGDLMVYTTERHASDPVMKKLLENIRYGRLQESNVNSLRIAAALLKNHGTELAKGDNDTRIITVGDSSVVINSDGQISKVTGDIRAVNESMKDSFAEVKQEYASVLHARTDVWKKLEQLAETETSTVIPVDPPTDKDRDFVKKDVEAIAQGTKAFQAYKITDNVMGIIVNDAIAAPMFSRAEVHQEGNKNYKAGDIVPAQLAATIQFNGANLTTGTVAAFLNDVERNNQDLTKQERDFVSFAVRQGLLQKVNGKWAGKDNTALFAVYVNAEKPDVKTAQAAFKHEKIHSVEAVDTNNLATNAATIKELDLKAVMPVYDAQGKIIKGKTINLMDVARDFLVLQGYQKADTELMDRELVAWLADVSTMQERVQQSLNSKDISNQMAERMATVRPLVQSQYAAKWKEIEQTFVKNHQDAVERIQLNQKMQRDTGLKPVVMGIRSVYEPQVIDVILNKDAMKAPALRLPTSLNSPEVYTLKAGDSLLSEATVNSTLIKISPTPSQKENGVKAVNFAVQGTSEPVIQSIEINVNKAIREAVGQLPVEQQKTIFVNGQIPAFLTVSPSAYNAIAKVMNPKNPIVVGDNNQVFGMKQPYSEVRVNTESFGNNTATSRTAAVAEMLVAAMTSGSSSISSQKENVNKTTVAPGRDNSMSAATLLNLNERQLKDYLKTSNIGAENFAQAVEIMRDLRNDAAIVALKQEALTKPTDPELRERLTRAVVIRLNGLTSSNDAGEEIAQETSKPSTDWETFAKDALPSVDLLPQASLKPAYVIDPKTNTIVREQAGVTSKATSPQERAVVNTLTALSKIAAVASDNRAPSLAYTSALRAVNTAAVKPEAALDNIRNRPAPQSDMLTHLLTLNDVRTYDSVLLDRPLRDVLNVSIAATDDRVVEAVRNIKDIALKNKIIAMVTQKISENLANSISDDNARQTISGVIARRAVNNSLDVLRFTPEDKVIYDNVIKEQAEQAFVQANEIVIPQLEVVEKVLKLNGGDVKVPAVRVAIEQIKGMNDSGVYVPERLSIFAQMVNSLNITDEKLDEMVRNNLITIQEKRTVEGITTNPDKNALQVMAQKVTAFTPDQVKARIQSVGALNNLAVPGKDSAMQADKDVERTAIILDSFDLNAPTLRRAKQLTGGLPGQLTVSDAVKGSVYAYDYADRKTQEIIRAMVRDAGAFANDNIYNKIRDIPSETAPIDYIAKVVNDGLTSIEDTVLRYRVSREIATRSLENPALLRGFTPAVVEQLKPILIRETQETVPAALMPEQEQNLVGSKTIGRADIESLETYKSMLPVLNSPRIPAEVKEQSLIDMARRRGVKISPELLSEIRNNQVMPQAQTEVSTSASTLPEKPETTNGLRNLKAAIVIAAALGGHAQITNDVENTATNYSPDPTTVQSIDGRPTVIVPATLRQSENGVSGVIVQVTSKGEEKIGTVFNNTPEVTSAIQALPKNVALASPEGYIVRDPKIADQIVRNVREAREVKPATLTERIKDNYKSIALIVVGLLASAGLVAKKMSKKDVAEKEQPKFVDTKPTIVTGWDQKTEQAIARHADIRKLLGATNATSDQEVMQKLEKLYRTDSTLTPKDRERVATRRAIISEIIPQVIATVENEAQEPREQKTAKHKISVNEVREAGAISVISAIGDKEPIKTARFGLDANNEAVRDAIKRLPKELQPKAVINKDGKSLYEVNPIVFKDIVLLQLQNAYNQLKNGSAQENLSGGHIGALINLSLALNEQTNDQKGYQDTRDLESKFESLISSKQTIPTDAMSLNRKVYERASRAYFKSSSVLDRFKLEERDPRFRDYKEWMDVTERLVAIKENPKTSTENVFASYNPEVMFANLEELMSTKSSENVKKAIIQRLTEIRKDMLSDTDETLVNLWEKVRKNGTPQEIAKFNQIILQRLENNVKAPSLVQPVIDALSEELKHMTANQANELLLAGKGSVIKAVTDRLENRINEILLDSNDKDVSIAILHEVTNAVETTFRQNKEFQKISPKEEVDTIAEVLYQRAQRFTGTNTSSHQAPKSKADQAMGAFLSLLGINQDNAQTVESTQIGGEKSKTVAEGIGRGFMELMNNAMAVKVNEEAGISAVDMMSKGAAEITNVLEKMGFERREIERINRLAQKKRISPVVRASYEELMAMPNDNKAYAKKLRDFERLFTTEANEKNTEQQFKEAIPSEIFTKKYIKEISIDGKTIATEWEKPSISNGHQGAVIAVDKTPGALSGVEETTYRIFINPEGQSKPRIDTYAFLADTLKADEKASVKILNRNNYLLTSVTAEGASQIFAKKINKAAAEIKAGKPAAQVNDDTLKAVIKESEKLLANMTVVTDSEKQHNDALKKAVRDLTKSLSTQKNAEPRTPKDRAQVAPKSAPVVKDYAQSAKQFSELRTAVKRAGNDAATSADYFDLLVHVGDEGFAQKFAKIDPAMREAVLKSETIFRIETARDRNSAMLNSRGERTQPELHSRSSQVGSSVQTSSSGITDKWADDKTWVEYKLPKIEDAAMKVQEFFNHRTKKLFGKDFTEADNFAQGVDYEELADLRAFLREQFGPLAWDSDAKIIASLVAMGKEGLEKLEYADRQYVLQQIIGTVLIGDKDSPEITEIPKDIETRAVAIVKEVVSKLGFESTSTVPAVNAILAVDHQTFNAYKALHLERMAAAANDAEKEQAKQASISWFKRWKIAPAQAEQIVAALNDNKSFEDIKPLLMIEKAKPRAIVSAQNITSVEVTMPTAPASNMDQYQQNDIDNQPMDAVTPYNNNFGDDDINGAEPAIIPMPVITPPTMPIIMPLSQIMDAGNPRVARASANDANVAYDVNAPSANDVVYLKTGTDAAMIAEKISNTLEQSARTGNVPVMVYGYERIKQKGQVEWGKKEELLLREDLAKRGLQVVDLTRNTILAVAKMPESQRSQVVFVAAANQSLDTLYDNKEVAAALVELTSVPSASTAQELYTLQNATRDPLTGLPTRQSAGRIFERTIDSQLRNGDAKAHVVFLDADFFKVVNDVFGHEVGDDVLKALGKDLSTSLRLGDIAFRWGGEEFVLILPGEMSEEQVKAVVQRTKSKVNELLQNTILGDNDAVVRNLRIATNKAEGERQRIVDAIRLQFMAQRDEDEQTVIAKTPDLESAIDAFEAARLPWEISFSAGASGIEVSKTDNVKPIPEILERWFKEQVAIADKKLYEAKQNGRNQTVVAPASISEINVMNVDGRRAINNIGGALSTEEILVNAEAANTVPVLVYGYEKPQGLAQRAWGNREEDLMREDLERHNKQVLQLNNRNILAIAQMSNSQRSRVVLVAAANQSLDAMYDNKEVGAALVKITSVQSAATAQELYTLQNSTRDPLTGLPTRQSAGRIFERTIDSQLRNGDAKAHVVFLDADFFKVVNDVYGHEVGDDVLKALGEDLRTSLRLGDIAFRWGGEEFVLILPGEMSEEQVKAVVQRTKSKVNELLQNTILGDNDAVVRNLRAATGKTEGERQRILDAIRLQFIAQRDEDEQTVEAKTPDLETAIDAFEAARLPWEISFSAGASGIEVSKTDNVKPIPEILERWFKEQVAIADKKLYEAKQNGRNQTVVAGTVNTANHAMVTDTKAILVQFDRVTEAVENILSSESKFDADKFVEQVKIARELVRMNIAVAPNAQGKSLAKFMAALSYVAAGAPALILVREPNDLTKFFKELIIPQGSMTFEALADQVGVQLGRTFKVANIDALIKAHEASQQQRQQEKSKDSKTLESLQDQIKAREDDIVNALNDNDVIKVISLTPRGHLPNNFSDSPQVLAGIKKIKEYGVTIVDEIDDMILIVATYVQAASENFGNNIVLKDLGKQVQAFYKEVFQNNQLQVRVAQTREAFNDAEEIVWNNKQLPQNSLTGESDFLVSKALYKKYSKYDPHLVESILRGLVEDIGQRLTIGKNSQGKRQLVPSDRTGRPLDDQIFGQLPYQIVQTLKYNALHPEDQLKIEDIVLSTRTTKENPVNEIFEGNVTGVSATLSGAEALLKAKTGVGEIVVIGAQSNVYEQIAQFKDHIQHVEPIAVAGDQQFAKVAALAHDMRSGTNANGANRLLALVDGPKGAEELTAYLGKDFEVAYLDGTDENLVAEAVNGEVNGKVYVALPMFAKQFSFKGNLDVVVVNAQRWPTTDLTHGVNRNIRDQKNDRGNKYILYDQDEVGRSLEFILKQISDIKALPNLPPSLIADIDRINALGNAADDIERLKAVTEYRQLLQRSNAYKHAVLTFFRNINSTQTINEWMKIATPEEKDLLSPIFFKEAAGWYGNTMQELLDSYISGADWFARAHLISIEGANHMAQDAITILDDKQGTHKDLLAIIKQFTLELASRKALSLPTEDELQEPAKGLNKVTSYEDKYKEAARLISGILPTNIANFNERASVDAKESNDANVHVQTFLGKIGLDPKDVHVNLSDIMPNVMAIYEAAKAQGQTKIVRALQTLYTAGQKWQMAQAIYRENKYKEYTTQSEKAFKLAVRAIHGLTPQSLLDIIEGSNGTVTATEAVQALGIEKLVGSILEQASSLQNNEKEAVRLRSVAKVLLEKLEALRSATQDEDKKEKGVVPSVPNSPNPVDENGTFAGRSPIILPGSPIGQMPAPITNTSPTPVPGGTMTPISPMGVTNTVPTGANASNANTVPVAPSNANTTPVRALTGPATPLGLTYNPINTTPNANANTNTLPTTEAPAPATPPTNTVPNNTVPLTVPIPAPGSGFGSPPIIFGLGDGKSRYIIQQSSIRPEYLAGHSSYKDKLGAWQSDHAPGRIDSVAVFLKSSPTDEKVGNGEKCTSACSTSSCSKNSSFCENHAESGLAQALTTRTLEAQ